ncbi:putative alpha-1,3-glucanase/mutanase [Podospora appendiculata]|uniref:Alpha-1,3-glucanase/mutanase n=1 Tax=Podospora appendiculata TaxID=314037 RepID=A0AAE1C804_9PEZI|nr:putative alpha-1,3-glucanase/mutanase [Podospora appendiculata]
MAQILSNRSLVRKQTSTSGASATDKLVFCHFMIGIVGQRQTAADYDTDMKRAKALGIDAFALNIGVDPYTDTQLDLAYASAASNGMKVFISFDFNWFSRGDAQVVGQKIAKYGSKPAQLVVDGKIFASSFSGDGLDVSAMRAAAGVDVFWAPNFSPSQTADPTHLDAALNWMAWPNNGQNKAPSPGAEVTVQDGDNAYTQWLGSKPYIAPVSPWFSTHFGPEVSYSKNWVFPSDLLWYERLTEVLASKPQYIELVTWNDYGESHYLTSLSSTHYDDGNSKWVNDMPHDGWLDMAKPFLAAFKAGADKVDDYIEEDQIIYWYRPTLKSLDCDATDTTMKAANNESGNYFMGRPAGHETMEDSVFVVTLLKAAGSVSVTSGGNKAVTFSAPAGAYAQKVPMGVGQQAFELTRDGKSVLSGTSLKDISDVCICGIYNFNAYVGKLPFEGFGTLDKDGLASLTAGLHVSTCSPTPSLGSGETATGGFTTITQAPSTQPTITPPPAASTTVAPTASDVVPSPSSVPSSGPNPHPPSNGTCTAGTAASGMPDNFTGLCQFSCARGYCPPGVCVCTSTSRPAFGAQSVKAEWTKPPGCPLPTLNDGYKGLCAFSCANDYCPDTACTPTC